EGLTRVDDKLLQLTWQNGFGYAYDLELNQLETFRFKESKEGWGLAYNGEHLYKTDGTDKIWVLDAKDYSEQYYIEAVTDEIRLKSLNELDFIDGKLYANTYQKESIVIINPQNGAVEGLISLKGLKENIGNKRTADVLNGVAYKASTEELFVTGKNWDKLFVIEIIPVE
ncbi:MAG: glutaminyl-peptide cyclotransferase, partial [Flavobacteriaceae bacterium]|nr:glutaminyl-peptide cyclotransferase [Flavobacteriaceae bacterium]